MPLANPDPPHGGYMKKVLVTGGTGVVGKTLVKQLIKKGYDVRILTRHGFHAGSENLIDLTTLTGKDQGVLNGKDQIFSKIELFYGDIRDADALDLAVKDVSIVFHLAAVLDNYSLSRKDYFQGKNLYNVYREVNVKATEMLVKAACKAGVDRIVFFSSISVYGKGERVDSADENTPLCPDSLYAVSKAEAEKHVLAGINHRKEPIGVVLRPASVYGPKEKKNYTRLIKMMQHGFFVTVGNGRTKRTLIHDHDLAEAAVIAAENTKACGNVYNVSDGCVHSLNDIRKAIAEALDKKYINMRIPEKWVWLLIFLLGKFMHVGSIASGLENMVTDMAVSADKIRYELGFKPEIQLYKGWKNAVKRAL